MLSAIQLYTNDAFRSWIYKLTLDGKVVGMLGKAGSSNSSTGFMV